MPPTPTPFVGVCAAAAAAAAALLAALLAVALPGRGALLGVVVLVCLLGVGVGVVVCLLGVGAAACLPGVVGSLGGVDVTHALLPGGVAGCVLAAALLLPTFPPEAKPGVGLVG